MPENMYDKIREAVSNDPYNATIPTLKEFLAKAVKNHAPLPNILLYGPPGTGKTYTALELARFIMEALKREGEPEVTQFTSDDTKFDVLYGTIPSNVTASGFERFKEAHLRGWERGVPTITNEIVEARGTSAMASLHTMMDDQELAQMSTPTDGVLKPTYGYVHIATMNGLPEAIAKEAVLDRFSVRIFVGQPSPEAIETIPFPEARAFVEMAYEEATPPVTFRQMKAWCSMLQTMGYKTVKNKAELVENPISQMVFGVVAREVVSAIISRTNLSALRQENAREQWDNCGVGDQNHLGDTLDGDRDFKCKHCGDYYKKSRGFMLDRPCGCTN